MDLQEQADGAAREKKEATKQDGSGQTSSQPAQPPDIAPSYPTPHSINGMPLSKHQLQIDAMQVKMLEALTELSKNNHNDVKEKTLNAVDMLLQSSGQTLNSGYFSSPLHTVVPKINIVLSGGHYC